MKRMLRNCWVGIGAFGCAWSLIAQDATAPAAAGAEQPAAAPAPAAVLAPAAAAGPVVAPGTHPPMDRVKMAELRQERLRLVRSIGEMETKLLQEKPEVKEKLAKNQEDIKALREQEKQIRVEVEKMNRQRDEIMMNASPEIAEARARIVKIEEEIRGFAASPASFRPPRERVRVKPGSGVEMSTPVPASPTPPGDGAAAVPKPPEPPNPTDVKKE